MEQVVGPKYDSQGNPRQAYDQSFAREVYQKGGFGGRDQDVHAVRGLCRLLPAEGQDGFFPPKDIHPDPGRATGKGAEQPGHHALHLLLLLQGALSPEGAGGGCHARAGPLRPAPGLYPQAEIGPVRREVLGQYLPAGPDRREGRGQPLLLRPRHRRRGSS